MNQRATTDETTFGYETITCQQPKASVKAVGEQSRNNYFRKLETRVNDKTNEFEKVWGVQLPNVKRISLKSFPV